MDKNKMMAVSGAGGFVAGAFIGYLYRPPAFLTGQLPFKHVISRGTTLKGFEQIYIQVAQTSFNYLIMGGLIGAMLGVVAVILYQNKAK